MADRQYTFTPEQVKARATSVRKDPVCTAERTADMLDQFAALLEATAWRDISSAPKDGTRFRGTFKHSNPHYGWIQTDARWYFDSRIDNGEGGYFVMDGGGVPTHWLPLPPAPQEAP